MIYISWVIKFFPFHKVFLDYVYVFSDLD